MPNRLFLLLLSSILFFIGCQKEIFRTANQQAGAYIGNLRVQSTAHRTDFANYDPITNRPLDNEMVIVETIQIDTIYIDTIAQVVVQKDSIFFYSFNGTNNFLVNEESVYRNAYPGYTSTDFSFRGDTLEIYDTFVINRGSSHPGQSQKTFIGIKQ